jgi:transposase
MGTPPDLQVYDLGHLGLVASVLDRIRLVETVDRLVGPRPGEKVSTGMALKAALLNALGFIASPLYLFGHFFQGKPTEHLLGPGITPDLLNDDRMGRMLDTLYAAGVTEVFLEVAKEARRAFPFPVRALHADATSFHVHGQYEGLGEEVGAIRVTYGYSRDHRPDLKQWVMNLVCADTGGIPLLFAPGDGNQSDREALVPLLARYRQALDLGAVVVLDGAGYSRENLRALEGFSCRHSAPLPPCLRILGWEPHPTSRSTTWATWAWWLACWTESGWWRPWTASWALGPGKRSPPVWPSRPPS